MKFFITDVFGTGKYTGNQLATFFDFNNEISDTEMQQIAREINFSETTFVTSSTKENGGYNVRIFTPESEIDFAGHPTLGTAFIIKKHLENDTGNPVILNLRVGQVPVIKRDSVLWMTQKQPIFGKHLNKRLLAGVLTISEDAIDTQQPVEEVSTGLPFTIVPLKSLSGLIQAKINMAEYEKFMHITHAKGILIYCSEGSETGQDITTRVFVPYLGIPEDPATGSATGCLAAYLLKNNILKQSKINLTVGQGYQVNRPSVLYMDASISNDFYNLSIGGNVVEIAEGVWS